MCSREVQLSSATARIARPVDHVRQPRERGVVLLSPSVISRGSPFEAPCRLVRPICLDTLAWLGLPSSCDVG